MTELQNRLGASILGAIVADDLGWLFREQHVSDQGIDAHVEVAENESGTGRLVALQIKSGKSWFREKIPGGWVFRLTDRERRLWLGHALPVIVVLVDTKTKTAYWERITATTVVSTGKRYKILVPDRQTVSEAAVEWNHIASGIELRALERYELNLTYLPPSARKPIEEHFATSKLDVSVLAMHLAQGRSNPVGTLQGLLATEPGWITRHGAWSWQAVAAYAAEHGALRESAEAFLRAAKFNPQGAGRLTAAAALNCMPISARESRKLLATAKELGGAQLLVAVGEALLDHPEGDAGPRRIDPALLEDTEEVRASEMINKFLADQAVRANRLPAAIEYAEKALIASPESTDAMTIYARALGIRGSTTDRQQDDLSRAEDLYKQAIEQRRKWAGPTQELLIDLAKPLALRGRFSEMLEWYLPPPTGLATVDEARNAKLLRYALMAARFASRSELVEVIAEQMGDDPHDQVARYRAGLLDLSNEEAETLWRTELARAHQQQDFEAMVHAVTSLATLGIDESSHLSDAVAAHIVPPEMQQLASALATAVVNADEGIPQLRALARTNASAAEYLIVALKRSGHPEAAIQASRAAYDAFRAPYFLIMRAELSIATGDDQAEAAATQAIQGTDEFPADRERLSSFLADRAVSRGDWAQAEAVMTAATRMSAQPLTKTVWNLIEVQLGAGHTVRALETIRRFRPLVRDADEARCWLRTMIHTDWDAALTSEALSLGTRFSDQPELATAFFGHVITATRGISDAGLAEDSDVTEPDGATTPSLPGELQLPAVPGDLHRQAFEMLGRLVAQHGEATGVRIISGEPDELVSQISEIVRSQAALPLDELLEKIARGHVPAGLLSSTRRRSYAQLLVQHASGPLVGSSMNDEEHQDEIAAAAEAVGLEVVVETSALLVASRISAGKELRSQFLSLITPPVARRDIGQAGMDLRTLAASPGTVGWDARRQVPAFYELTAAEYAEWQQRIHGLETVAGETLVRGAAGVSRFPELKSPMDLAPWLVPIDLASQENLALWSDDLAVRRIARSVGVRSFGTMALLDHLANTRIAAAHNDIDVERAISMLHTAVRELVSEQVVDVPASLDDVLAQAASDSWLPRSAALVVSRPAWWSWRKEPLEELVLLYRSVEAHRPESLPDWQFAVMLGLGRGQSDPSQASLILAVVALLGTVAEPSVPDVVDGCLRARDVAERLNLPDPATQLPFARELLLQDGHVRSAELIEQALRELA
ncbi:DUF4365 domain-containing protein [Cellulomonas cellasea]|uniref:Tetratricopeptide (TPR) repeat protein n=1 Tax=Cellulomonas cellasea TaxID=43670 RepID=A0A7W4YCY5_9CELL|nr:DUF4365 domain-containing protein [Cellulomonas cellasea]MBB2924011.1 tetratricopeptide (TPR) repeat protein [Cellulomonas cellasea]